MTAAPATETTTTTTAKTATPSATTTAKTTTAPATKTATTATWLATAVPSVRMALRAGTVAAKALRFHVAVFVAATEDAQNLASAPLAHAMAAFGETVQRWAVEDDCQAVGDPALLLWARAAVVMPFRARGRAGEEDGSRSINGSAPADGSAAEAAAGTAAAEDSEVFLTEESVLGDDETDRSFPAALGVTAHATSTLRRLLRRVKRGGKPFTVCRPGYGRLCF
jgi:hypothetical protein